ncbi:MAG TPA: glycosyltransferase [Gammaproteobacteria bacterium]|nr:glycosyltransferase [Gammaproteobacteria bacterium]
MARILAHRGIRIIFLCHNAVDHEAAGWKLQITKRVLRCGAGFVVHNRSDREALVQLLGGGAISLCPLPVYSQFGGAGSRKLPRRGKLELLFFGFVRHYKGLDVLLKALQYLPREQFFLQIVGEFWQGEDEYKDLVTNLDLVGNVEFVPRYVPEEEASSYFQRADFVILPYRSATGSAVTGLAYNFDKPVVVTNVGGLPDVVVEGETGFIVPPESPDKLAELLRSLSAEKASSMAAHIRRHKRTMTWEAYAQVCLDLSCSHAEGESQTGSERA